MPIFFGLTGGYPVGAKTISDLYREGKLLRTEAERLFYWCVNAGPAFTVSAVGVMMMGSLKSGIILYAAVVLSAVTVGLFCRFLATPHTPIDFETLPTQHGSVLGATVSSAADACVNIVAWVLTFSSISSVLSSVIKDGYTLRFMKAVSEVTTGCQSLCREVPLGVVGAMVGFGGVSVICQVIPYLEICSVQVKRFAAAKAVSAALTAFYTEILLYFFPVTLPTSVTFTTPLADLCFSYSAPLFGVLLMMCGVLILELDKGKKV